MSSKEVAVAVALAVVAGLGWARFLAGPASEPMPLVHATFQPVGDQPQAPAPSGPDTAPDWRDRQALRARLTTAMDQLEAQPCATQARTAFLDAFVAKAMALMADSRNSPDENGPAFWRTTDDQVINDRIEALKKDGLTSDGEITRAMMEHNPITAAMQIGQPHTPEDEAPVLSSNRCAKAAAGS